jgi:hypothetical protein
MKRSLTKLGRTIVSCSLTILGAAYAVPSADAQAVSRSDYFIQHNFQVQPFGAIVTNVRGLDFAHAWVQEPGRNATQTNPAAQPPAYSPFGNDSLFAGSFVLNRAAPNAPFGVLANRNSFNVPFNGISRTDQANIPAPVSSARGRSNVTVGPWFPGGPIMGSITSDGFAEARLNGAGNASAYAFSSSTVEARGLGFFGGQIFWGPIIRDSVAGSAQANVNVPPTRRRSDPISFRLFDGPNDTTPFLEGNLLDIETELFHDGDLIWDNGRMSISSPDADLDVRINPQFVADPGDVTFRVRNGIVTQSDDSGIFDGMLPTVGSVGPFDFDFPQTLTLNYTLPTAGDYEIVMGGGSHVPEPAAALAGLLLTPLLLLRRRTRGS